LDYLDYVTSTHSLYDRYESEWRLCINSFYGGVEYRRAQYLRAYTGDFNTPGETINTFVVNDDGSVVSKTRARVEYGVSADSTERGQDVIADSFYGEKLEHTPLYNYVKLIVNEYNSMLFRNAPQRDMPAEDPYVEFVQDVDGEGNSINEFMAQVDQFSTIYGVCHVACYKPIGSDIPKWRIHTPLDVTNWDYYYDVDGELKLKSVVIRTESNDMHTVYRCITAESFDTVFVGCDSDYIPPIQGEMENIGEGAYRISQPNELGYIPMVSVYQNIKIYNGVGSTTIQDVAQIQRSIYADMAELYTAITYGSHPVTIVDETTEQLNNGEIGSEPGAMIRVQNSLSGEQNYVFEFRAPPLDAISEISDLVDNKVEKLMQIAMLRSADLVKYSRSGEQVEQYDDKLNGLIRKKATNLENAEYQLWQIWADWQNIPLSEDFSISYSRQYNKRALEHEIVELEKLLDVFQRSSELLDLQPDDEMRDRIRSRLSELLMATSTHNSL